MTNHGVPSSCAPGVVETGDRRVIQLRERALLAGEAVAPRRREPGVAQELDGDLVLKVVAFCQIDDARSALAEQPDDAVGPEGGRCER